MNWLLPRALKEHDYFYYLVHPRDLVDYQNDLSQDFREKYKDELVVFESLELSIDKKLDYMEHVLGLIEQSGRKFVTLAEMTKNIVETLKH